MGWRPRPSLASIVLRPAWNVIIFKKISNFKNVFLEKYQQMLHFWHHCSAGCGEATGSSHTLKLLYSSIPLPTSTLWGTSPWQSSYPLYISNCQCEKQPAHRCACLSPGSMSVIWEWRVPWAQTSGRVCHIHSLAHWPLAEWEQGEADPWRRSCPVALWNCVTELLNK